MPPVAAPQIACPTPATTFVFANTTSAVVTYADPVVTGGAKPFATSCTPVSGSSFAVGSSTVTCRTTDALARTNSCTFNVVVSVAPQIALTRFVAFGDSITWGQDGAIAGECPAEVPLFMPLAFTSRALTARARDQLPLSEQYPMQLQMALQGRYVLQASSISVFNDGLGGEAAESQGQCGARSRFDNGGSCQGTIFPSVLTGGYQAVLIMEGANDLGPGNSLTAAIAGLRGMVDDAKSAGVRPYLATIPPEEVDETQPCPRGSPNSQVIALNSQIQMLAASEGITPVDVYSAFPSGDLIGLGLLGHDGLHPTPSGYSLIANAFLQKLESTLEIAH